MKRRSHLVLTLGCLALAACMDDPLAIRPPSEPGDPSFSTIQASGFSAIPLGVLGTGTYSYANGINDAGEIVGWSTIDDALGHRAFHWSAGVMTALKLPPDVTLEYSDASAVNRHGEIAGYVINAAFAGRAVVWEDAESEPTDLGVIGQNSYATALSNEGHVVGITWEGGGPNRAFIWANGETTLLPLLPGYASSRALGVNDAGDVVGHMGYVHPVDPASRAVVWRNGQVVALPVDNPMTDSHAIGINNDGIVVGDSGYEFDHRGAMWVPSGGSYELVDLGALPARPYGEQTIAMAINENGAIVGHGWKWDGSDLQLHAVMWDGGGMMEFPVVGSEARSINRHGDVAGQVRGYSPGSASMAMLWTRNGTPPPPPPPSGGNTAVGSNVLVRPVDVTTGALSPVSLLFSSVTAEGETSVASGTVGQSGGPLPPSGFRLGSPPTYFELTTTAAYEGSITVCIAYASVSYGNPNALKMLHREANGTWVDATTTLDANAAVICGEVDSLSPFLVAETNFAPLVTRIALPLDPVAVGNIVSVTADFTDDNPGDTHTAEFDWGPTAGAATVNQAAGTASGTHAYAAPGVYVVHVSISDGALSGDRSSLADVPAYIVVYDPSAGFVTGGGWIESPLGACQFTIACADVAGRANFGFNVRYRRGAHVPDGNAQFQFKAGGLDFRAVDYEWLVVAGARAQFKGAGMINGAGGYGFLLTAVDGRVSGGGGIDRFRIKIWDRASGDVLYDNQMGEDEDSPAATALGGGRIVVHR